MKFSFMRSEYESAVEKSLADAVAIERSRSLPVFFGEGSVHHVSDLERPIEQRVGHERAYIKRYLDDRIAWRAKFGRLFGATLDVRLNGAKVYKFSSPDLIAAASASNRTIEDRNSFVAKIVSASDEECPALLNAIVEDGPWSEICLYGWLEVGGERVDVDEQTLASIGVNVWQSPPPTITYSRSG
jgi:hypothetical protein